MSGGSYDYLCFKFGDRLPDTENLLKMAERLERTYPNTRAVRETEEILRCLGKIRKSASLLYEVWHAVEWCDSGDSSEEWVKKAIELLEASGL